MYQIETFDIDSILIDPSRTHKEMMEKFLNWCAETMKFSKDLTDLMRKNSKMSNWPAKFNSKESIGRNKEEFKKLSKKIILLIELYLEKH